MLKKLSLSLLCAGLTAFCSIHGIYQHEIDGKPLLVPSVQQYTENPGTLTLPSVLTVTPPKNEPAILELLTQEVSRFSNMSVQSVRSNALLQFELTQKNMPQHEQGYVLTIGSKNILIQAKTNEGLFWGFQTFRNLLRNATGPTLKNCTITDWPDFNRRGYFFTIRGVKSAQLPQLKKMFDALSALKMNWLLLEVAEAFPYENNQLTKRPNSFTREEMIDLRDFCQSRHLEIAPTLQVLSHSLWMTYHPDWASMSEGTPRSLWNSQPCILNEKAKQLTKDVLSQQLKFFQPKIFFIMMDEITLGPHGCCEKCKQYPFDELVSNYINEIEKHVQSYNARAMICQDSFIGHGALPNSDKIRARLNKDDLILWWSYSESLPEKTILPYKDFQLVGHALHGKPKNLIDMCHLIKKHGGNDCTIVYWYYSARGTLFDLQQETPDSYGGFVNCCDYMWKLDNVYYTDLPYDGTYEMMRLLHPEMLRAQPSQSTGIPLPFDESIANCELSNSGEFPQLNEEMTQQIAETLSAMPEKFHLMRGKDGEYFGLRLSDIYKKDAGRHGISLKMGNRKFERLSVLMTATRPENADLYISNGKYGRLRFAKDKVAKITIEYTDKTSVKTDLYYRYDVNEWNRPFGGFTMHNVVRGVDVNGKFFTFGACEIVNPHPEKTVNRVLYSSYFLKGVSPVILAVSAFGCDKPFAAPPARLNAQKLTIPYPPKAKEKAPEIHLVNDFESGKGNIKVWNWGGNIKSIKAEVVEDPTVPSNGKNVLKITTIPNVDKKTGLPSSGSFRVIVDLPYTISPETKSLVLTHRMNDLEGFSRIQDYLVAADKSTHRFYTGRIGIYWRRNSYPLVNESNSSPMLTNPQDAALRRISYFFDDITKPNVIYIDNIGDSTEQIQGVNDWMFGGEAE